MIGPENVGTANAGPGNFRSGSVSSGIVCPGNIGLGNDTKSVLDSYLWDFDWALLLLCWWISQQQAFNQERNWPDWAMGAYVQ